MLKCYGEHFNPCWFGGLLHVFLCCTYITVCLSPLMWAVSQNWREKWGIKRSLPGVTELTDTCQVFPCCNMSRRSYTDAWTIIQLYIYYLHTLITSHTKTHLYYYSFVLALNSNWFFTYVSHLILLFQPVLFQMEIFITTPSIKTLCEQLEIKRSEQ